MANSRLGLRTRPGVIRNYTQGSAGGDADANLFLDAALITDPTITSAIQQLVIDLKNYGLWSKMKAIYPFVGGTAATHKFNLKDARDLDVAYRLKFYGGNTHSSTGWLPNGTTGYADSFLNDSALIPNDAHLSFYSRTSTTNSTYDMGIYNGTKGIWMGISDATYNFRGAIFQTGAAGEVNANVTNSQGFYLACKNGSTTVTIYRNGTSVASSAKTDQTSTNTSVYIGSLNQNGVPSFGFSQKEFAFASIGDGLSGSQVTDYNNIITTFQTTLGRQV